MSVIVKVSGVEENKFYPLRRSKYELEKKVINLLLIAEEEVDEDGKAVNQRYYTTIKSLSRLIASGNSKT